MFDCDNKQCPYHPDNNVALSWDELRQMEGKPVWVEIGGKGAWDIVWRTGKIYEGEDHDTWMWFYVGHKLPKTTYDSNGWQAYRKERTNGQQD